MHNSFGTSCPLASPHLLPFIRACCLFLSVSLLFSFFSYDLIYAPTLTMLFYFLHVFHFPILPLPLVVSLHSQCGYRSTHPLSLSVLPSPVTPTLQPLSSAPVQKNLAYIERTMASTSALSTASLLALSLLALLAGSPEGAASESLTVTALRQLLPVGSSAPGGVGSAVWLPVPGRSPAELLLQPATIRSPYLRSVLLDGESAPPPGTVSLWQTLAIVQGVVGQFMSEARRRVAWKGGREREKESEQPPALCDST